MIILYGIRNCDSVKKARQWLEQHRIDYRYHDFRQDGINQAMVQRWLDATSLETLVNKRGTTWKALDEACKTALSNENAAALCAEHETLVKRPVLESGNRVYLGFNEKLYQEIFKP